MAELRALLEDLRCGGKPELSVADVDALTGWLCRSGNRASGMDAGLPTPRHDPVLRKMVFYQLDSTLFVGGELRLPAAGLDHGQPEEDRRQRFRRLISAFHPDRYPDLADWLTQRSQIVHRAYARFKKNPTAPPPRRTQQRPQSGMRASDPIRRRRQSLRETLLELRKRFGHDRHLAHKLVAGLALLALLPVVNIVLAPGVETVRSRTDDLSTEAANEDSGHNAQALRVERPEEDAVGIAEPNTITRPPVSEADGARENGNAVEPELLLAARRAMTLYGEVPPTAALPSVDAQLAAMGLALDPQRPYREFRRPVGDAGFTDGGDGGSVGSGKVERPTKDSGSQAGSKLSTKTDSEIPERAAAEGEDNTTNDSLSDLIVGLLNADRETATGNLESAPGRKAPASALPPGKLILGPLRFHPTGKLLRALHADLDAGDIEGVASHFATDARTQDMLGGTRIGEYFRDLPAAGDEHQVAMQVLRLERENALWRMEVSIEFRLRNGGRDELTRERATIWLIERDGAMSVSRMRAR